MNSNESLPSHKPATAKETNQTLQELGFTIPLRTINNDIKHDSELISHKALSNVDIVQPKNLRKSIAAAMSPMQPAIAAGNYRLKYEIKRSASSELLKIEDLKIYQSACAAYRLGLDRGWSKERLLESVEEWKAFGANSARR